MRLLFEEEGPSKAIYLVKEEAHQLMNEETALWEDFCKPHKTLFVVPKVSV